MPRSAARRRLGRPGACTPARRGLALQIEQGHFHRPLGEAVAEGGPVHPPADPFHVERIGPDDSSGASTSRISAMVPACVSPLQTLVTLASPRPTRPASSPMRTRTYWPTRCSPRELMMAMSRRIWP